MEYDQGFEDGLADDILPEDRGREYYDGYADGMAMMKRAESVFAEIQRALELVRS